MSTLINLTGQNFGKLTVVSRSKEPRKWSNALWHCQCECGKTTEVASNLLKNGNTKSCGCLRREDQSQRRKDITGQKFGLLTVIGFSRGAYGGSMWECLCECGNTTIARGSALRVGHTKSCGCLRSNSDKSRKKSDLVGQKFGLLTAIKEDGRGNGGKVYWFCRCECGNEKRVRGTDLTHGNTKSCGCQQTANLPTWKKDRV